MNPHPKKEGGYRFGVPEPEGTHDPEFLRYSVDLYNHGYYWESHVYFEALWNLHGREGSVADLFKGLIKLGAAGVKLSIDQKANARDHLIRARELLIEVRSKEGEHFMGFDLAEMIRDLDSGKEKLFISLKQS